MNQRTPQQDSPSFDTNLHWVKSSLSFCNSNCVEVASLPDGQIGVRDSKNPDGGVLQFTAGEWRAFIGGVYKGEFDSFAGLCPEDITNNILSRSLTAVHEGGRRACQLSLSPAFIFDRQIQPAAIPAPSAATVVSTCPVSPAPALSGT